jgi:YtxH-like protein
MPDKGDIMSTSDLLPSKDNIAEALRQLTGRSNPSDQLLSAVGIFAAGILTGAALAVLFAPKPGAELRQEIGARVGGLRDKIAKTAEGESDSSKPA